MLIVFSLLFFIFLVAAFIGLINPKWVFCKNLSRFKTFAVFLTVSGVFFILIGVTASREFEKRSQETAKKQEQDVKPSEKNAVTVQPSAVKSQEEKQNDSQTVPTKPLVQPALVSSSEEKQKDSSKISDSQTVHQPVAQAKPAPQPAKSPPELYVEKLNRELEGLNKLSVETYLSSKDSILICLALFSEYAKIAEEGNRLNLSGEHKKVLTQFKNKVATVQKQFFPRLRNAFGPIARQILWEHDLSAKTFGNGYKTIEFVGGVFAANRNIKQFQEKMSDMLHNLRFKKAQYKWYEQASNYDYYDIKSNDDSDLIVWTDDSHYRKVD